MTTTKTMAEEIVELRKLSVDALVERYTELYGARPRRRLKAWLWRRCAWRIQEARLGGLSKLAKARLEQLIAEIQIPLDEPGMTVTGRRRIPCRPRELGAGTILVRHYDGRERRLRILADGFELDDGSIHRSLTAAARSITGQPALNGRLWWRLTSRRKQS